jgi:hypothetical protein
MNAQPERLITGKRAEEDAAELALRPQTLDDFIGQKQVRENLKIFIAAAARPRRGARPRAVPRAALASARRRWRRSWRARWASASAPPPGR